MVKTRYSPYPKTLARCDLMMAAPAEDSNVFKQIFVDHWDGFKHVHPRYNTRYYDSLIDKMLNCGNPDQMGYIEYYCEHCGQGKHLVSRYLLLFVAVCFLRGRILAFIPHWDTYYFVFL